MDTRLTTYQDMIDHTIDFLGADPGGDAARDANRAVQNAYRDLAAVNRWSYYYTRGRLSVSCPFNSPSGVYSAGSFDPDPVFDAPLAPPPPIPPGPPTPIILTYTIWGGTVPRMVVISGGTWPWWVAQGMLVINNTIYEIATKVDDVTLILSIHSHPQHDVAATTNWQLYRDTYPLPVDCQAIDRMILVNYLFTMSYDNPGIWLERQRIYHSPAIPRSYTIRGDPKYQGAMAVSFFPAPDSELDFDYIYQRRPRRLTYAQITEGTVSAVQGNTTITGVGTNFWDKLVGSVIRLSWSNQQIPTGIAGPYPARLEGVIVAVAGPTSLTIDRCSDQTLTGVSYIISDPVDIEETAMLTPLQRGCEYQICISRIMASKAAALADYKQALIIGMEIDSRTFAVEAANRSTMYPYRLAQMPRGPDVS
jgi:hypothetical protein